MLTNQWDTQDFKPRRRLARFCIPTSLRLPSQVRAKRFSNLAQSGRQILTKCKLPQLHWSQQRCDNLHPLRLCHWVISALQIAGNILPNKNTLKLEARIFSLGLSKFPGFSATSLHCTGGSQKLTYLLALLHPYWNQDEAMTVLSALTHLIDLIQHISHHTRPNCSSTAAQFSSQHLSAGPMRSAMSRLHHLLHFTAFYLRQR